MKTYKNITAYQLTSLILCCAVVMGLAGCGGGGSSSTPTPVSSAPASSAISSLSSSSSSSVSSTIPDSVTYNVTVDIPVALLTDPQATLPQHKSGRLGATEFQAMKSDNLTADNFAVACVDLSGKILELPPLTDNGVNMNDDGSWSITVPQLYRLDCLIMVHLSQPFHLDVDEYITEANVVYSPTTADKINVSALSTATFNSLIKELGGLGTFGDVGIDTKDPQIIAAINNLVSNVTVLFAEKTHASTLAEIFNEVAPLIPPVVSQELDNINNPTAGTAVNLARNNGGMYIFNSDGDGITRQSLVGSTLVNQRYVGRAFVTSGVKNDDKDFVLSSDGWVQKSGDTTLDYSDGNGSVILVDATADGDKTVYKLTQGFHVGGNKIVEVLQTSPNTVALASIVNPDAVFPTGADGYRLEISIPQKYVIPNNTGDENGVCYTITDMLASHANGNCNQQEIRVDANIFQRPVVTYESLFSQDVGINAPGSRALTLGAVDRLGVTEVHRLDVQLINDGAKTVKYYARSWEGTAHAELIATGAWKELTLPNGNLAVYFDYPESVLAVGSIWSLQTYQAFTVQNGYVRHLEIHPPTVHTYNLLVFNSEANDAIISAIASNIDSPETAAVCFNPSLYEEGSRSVAIYRHPFSDGTFIDMLNEIEMKGQIDLNGQAASHSVVVVKAAARPQDAGDVAIYYFNVDINAMRINELGEEVSGSIQLGFFYSPGLLRRFDLKAGESFSQSYATRDDSGNVGNVAQVTTTFVGIESISVPAGTYDACRFDARGDSIWYMVGTGVTIKETWGSSGRELVSYSLNGTDL